MDTESKAIEESAKAVQEVAKTTNKLIDTGKAFGKYFKAPTEQIIGIWEDNLKFKRLENQLKLIQKADKKLKDLGLKTPTNQIPIKFAIPLLESASFEDDEYLQNLWVNLLINSSIDENKYTLERSHISILEQLTNLEARILITIYSNNYNQSNKIYNIKTHMLPDKIEYSIEEPWSFESAINSRDDTINNSKKEKYICPPHEIKLALANLSRLLCINFPITDGAECFNIVHPTLFGARLYEAVK